MMKRKMKMCVAVIITLLLSACGDSRDIEVQQRTIAKELLNEVMTETEPKTEEETKAQTEEEIKVYPEISVTSKLLAGGKVNISIVNKTDDTITIRLTNNTDTDIKLFSNPTMVLKGGESSELDPYKNMGVIATKVAPGTYHDYVFELTEDQSRELESVTGEIWGMSIYNDREYNIELSEFEQKTIAKELPSEIMTETDLTMEEETKVETKAQTEEETKAYPETSLVSGQLVGGKAIISIVNKTDDMVTIRLTNNTDIKLFSNPIMVLKGGKSSALDTYKNMSVTATKVASGTHYDYVFELTADQSRELEGVTGEIWGMGIYNDREYNLQLP